MVDSRNPLYDFGDEGEGEAPTFNERWGNLPVEAPRFNLTPNVALVESTPKPLKQGTDPVTGRPDLKFVPVDDPWANTPKPIKRLFGVGGEERHQLWPERTIRSGLGAFEDVLQGRLSLLDPDTGDVPRVTMEPNAFGKFLGMKETWQGVSPESMIGRAQDVASIGGPGGLMNLEEKGVLGSHGGNLVQPELHPVIANHIKDSVVKDVVYHGTPEVFDKFKADGGRQFFSDKPEVASRFAEEGAKQYGEGAAANVRPSYLNIKNPHIIDANGDFAGNFQFGRKGEEYKAALKNPDYDGVIIKNTKDEGNVYIVKNPNQILSSTALRSDTSKPGMAMAAINSQRAAPFYSAVEHAVSNIKQDKMPADQWLGTLTNSKGVKPEELDWTGLKDHLAEKGKEPVSKQEVQDYVNTNKVELKEINKGKYTEEQNARYQQLLNKKDRTSDEKTELKELIKNAEPPKFSQYQLPGGENYKEMLMTLPSQAGERPRGFPSTEAAQEWNNRAKNDYTSSHWDEPNVLAHVRTNDRNITAPGETTPKKSLHIEEIQSDWHQAGRQYGYKDGEPLTTRKQENSPHGNNVYEAVDHSGTVVGRGFSPDEALQAAKGMPSVPDAPFKKTWHELALKRMIREAAEKGYDRLSWTPGGANRTNPKVLGQTGEKAEKADKGLKRWYDEIIPQAIEKIGKEHGVKVKQGGAPKTNKPLIDQTERDKELQPVHYIDIPESLKNQALGKGFPLFSSGGHLLNPIPGNPHEQVDNSHHVPYGAGASNTPTGFPVNIDKRIPKYDDKLKLPNGQPANLHKYLTIHEIEEYKAMKAGIPYHKAHHDIATPMEKKAVESDGVSWSEYEHVMNGYLKETEEGGYKNLPPRLYTKPYPHSRSLKMDHGEDNGKDS